MDFMGLFSAMGSSGFTAKIKTMIESNLGKFAQKMKPTDCLIAMQSTDGQKLHMLKGTYTIETDKTLRVTISGNFDLAAIIAGMDINKVMAESEQKQITG